MSSEAHALQPILDRLLSNERYNPIIREIAQELHDGFEVMMCEAVTNNPGEPIDGLAILSILMTWTRTIKLSPDNNLRVPTPKGLPSQRHGNSLTDR